MPESARQKAATAAKRPMCCVRIGYTGSVLLPSDKAMKLVELLQHAVLCDATFEGHGYVYVVREQPEVELTTVKPTQIRMPEAARALQIEGPR